MRRQFEGNAIVYIDRGLNHPAGLAAQKLISATTRYRVLAVVDPTIIESGISVTREEQSQTSRLFGPRNTYWSTLAAPVETYPSSIPVVKQLSDGIHLALHRGHRPCRLLIGLDLINEQLSSHGRQVVLDALRWGLDVVHFSQYPLSDREELIQVSQQSGAKIININRFLPRRTRVPADAVDSINGHRIVVLGTSVSSNSTRFSWELIETMERNGCRAELIFTGLLTWLQGARFGSVFASIPLEQILGHLEQTVIDAWHSTHADAFIIECAGPPYGNDWEWMCRVVGAASPHAVVIHHDASAEQTVSVDAMIKAVKEVTQCSTILLTPEESVGKTEMDKLMDTVDSSVLAASAQPVLRL